jgi:hypothetical protein
MASDGLSRTVAARGDLEGIFIVESGTGKGIRLRFDGGLDQEVIGGDGRCADLALDSEYLLCARNAAETQTYSVVRKRIVGPGTQTVSVSSVEERTTLNPRIFAENNVALLVAERQLFAIPTASTIVPLPVEQDGFEPHEFPIAALLQGTRAFRLFSWSKRGRDFVESIGSLDGGTVKTEVRFVVPTDAGVPQSLRSSFVFANEDKVRVLAIHKKSESCQELRFFEGATARNATEMAIAQWGKTLVEFGHERMALLDEGKDIFAVLDVRRPSTETLYLIQPFESDFKMLRIDLPATGSEDEIFESAQLITLSNELLIISGAQDGRSLTRLHRLSRPELLKQFTTLGTAP